MRDLFKRKPGGTAVGNALRASSGVYRFLSMLFPAPKQ